MTAQTDPETPRSADPSSGRRNDVRSHRRRWWSSQPPSPARLDQKESRYLRYSILITYWVLAIVLGGFLVMYSADWGDLVFWRDGTFVGFRWLAWLLGLVATSLGWGVAGRKQGGPLNDSRVPLPRLRWLLIGPIGWVAAFAIYEFAADKWGPMCSLFY